MKNLPQEIFERKTTLVGFSSSILKHFGVTPFHESDPEIDSLLEDHKKVCVFLFDGAGKYNLSLFQKTNKFILEHAKHTIYSTNPPTTVAATNAFLTAKWPMENGWMGWSMYMKELGYPICVFPDTNSITGEKVNYFHDGRHYMDSYCPLVKIDTYMKDMGVNAKLEYLYPLGGENGPKNYRDMARHASKFFANGGEFLYSYTPHPDKEMHQYGVKSLHVKWEFFKINRMLKKFVKENPDVLVITMADHGLIDVEYVDLSEHEDFRSLMNGPMTIEGRNASFNVVKGKEKEFEELFAKYYPEFALLTREDVLEKGIFGVGEENHHFQEFLGDYLAIALDKKIFWDSKYSSFKKHLKAHHAGQTKEEREISLSFFNL